MNRALFLDRDGVINSKEPPVRYILSPSEFELLPRVLEALKIAKNKGYLTIVVTNQSCVGKKLITEERLAELNEFMKKLLTEDGVCYIDAVYYCPHLQEENCSCRKPKPGMLLQAAMDLGADLTKSVLVGDRETDLQAGQVAGCRVFLKKEGEELGELLHKILN